MKSGFVSIILLVGRTVRMRMICTITEKHKMFLLQRNDEIHQDAPLHTVDSVFMKNLRGLAQRFGHKTGS